MATISLLAGERASHPTLATCLAACSQGHNLMSLDKKDPTYQPAAATLMPTTRQAQRDVPSSQRETTLQAITLLPALPSEAAASVEISEAALVAEASAAAHVAEASEAAHVAAEEDNT